MVKLTVKQAEQRLIKYALTFPEAVLDHPWGHDAVKVKGKMFATFGGEEGAPKEFSMSVKLPVSSEMALTLSWVEPTGYGLGKSGWVSLAIRTADDAPDVDVLEEWLDESFRAIAPKKLIAQLDAAPAVRGRGSR